jgi:hypothetical protein
MDGGIGDRYFENVFCQASRHRCTLNRPGPKLAPLMPKKEWQESTPLFKTDAV